MATLIFDDERSCKERYAKYVYATYKVDPPAVALSLPRRYLDEICSHSLSSCSDAGQRNGAGSGANDDQQPDQRGAGIVSLHARHDGEHLFRAVGDGCGLFAR